MLWVYRLLFPFVLLAVSPGYLWRMRKRGGYGQNFKQRFGFHPVLGPRHAGRPRIWLQAVSVGEMLAIGPILEGLKGQGAEVYLTTTTSTGFRIANDRYLGLAQGVGYFPLDWWPFSARAWSRIDPDLVILTEGERWPEHVRQANRRKVRVVVINARLSDRSLRRMKRFPFVAPLMIAGLDRVLASSVQNERRFVEMGCPPDTVATTGNIKLDVVLTPLAEADQVRLRREVGLGPGLVLLGSSTWPGEEEALIKLVVRARAAGLQVSLLLVPRHAERRAELTGLVAAAGLSQHLRTRGPATAPVDVAIIDTTGELRTLAQLADVVVVGKSFLPHTEGQTPVEAVAWSKPVVFGPGMSNFREIAADMVARGAALAVADVAALGETVMALLAQAAARERLADGAKGWSRANLGAVQRTLDIIDGEIARVRR